MDIREGNAGVRPSGSKAAPLSFLLLFELRSREMYGRLPPKRVKRVVAACDQVHALLVGKGIGEKEFSRGMWKLLSATECKS